MNRLLATVSLFSLMLASAPTLLAQSATRDHLIMNQWVESTSSGALTGRVIRSNAEPAKLSGIAVAIVDDQGNVLETQTNTEGHFTISGVERGIYTLIARAPGVFACSAMHVISPDDNAGGRFPRLVTLRVADVDFATVNMAMIRYMPPKALTGNLSMSGANFEQLAEVVCGSESYRVARRDGGMSGSIHLAGPELQGVGATNVFILRDGVEVTRAITDADGRFFVKLDAGNYSLLTVGAGGIGLLGFELVGALDTRRADSALESSSERLVVTQDSSDACDQFAMQVAPTPELIDVGEASLVQNGSSGDDDGGAAVPIDGMGVDGFGTPVPGGGFATTGGGGGSFGGGGGGGGGALGAGGGIGGVAALAGLAGVAAAASNDSSSGVIIASPSSPN